MKRFSIFATLALSACATIPAEGVGPTARLGQTALIDALRIKPIKVMEDSRCPINVRCIWAGRIIVRTSIDGGAGAEIANLTLGEPLNLGGLTVTLIRAEPGTMAGQQINSRAYQFTYAVNRTL